MRDKERKKKERKKKRDGKNQIQNLTILTSDGHNS
jgi:hypothetical protein